MGKRFGTDGVRGVANLDLTPELACALGCCAAAVLLESWSGRERPFVVVGRDTRSSGEMLEAALAAGMCSQGVDVWSTAVLPTPGVAWLTCHTGALAGVVISASHNPPADNGIKFFGADGYKLPDSVEAAIEAAMEEVRERDTRPIGDRVGRILSRLDLVQVYQEFLTSLVKESLRDLRVAVDPGNGAAYALAPQVLRKVGVEVTVINDRPDGMNINVDCGSTNMTQLQQLVRSGQFNAGLAFDGDADRLLALDERGEPVDGDAVLFLCRMILPQLQDQRAIVATVMSNLGFEQALAERGIALHRAPVGDRYVQEMMRQLDCKLGGEQSGHIIFADLSTTGDGLITALQLLQTLRLGGKPLSELVARIPSYPQILINVPVQQRAGWEEDPEIRAVIRRAEEQLGQRGRILVRASGTEPLIRVMVEGMDAVAVEATATAIVQVVAARMGRSSAMAP